VHRHNARLPGSGQSAVGGTGAGLSDHRATCVTAESWCRRAAGIDGPTWVMATYKIADCTRYIPYPIYPSHMYTMGACRSDAMRDGLIGQHAAQLACRKHMRTRAHCCMLRCTCHAR
jgi:hypothetical protein